MLGNDINYLIPVHDINYVNLGFDFNHVMLGNDIFLLDDINYIQEDSNIVQVCIDIILGSVINKVMLDIYISILPCYVVIFAVYK